MNLLKSFLTLIFFVLYSVAYSQPGEGMISVKSNFSVEQTADNLEKILQDKGMNIFKRIDHQAGAAGVDMELRPTTLLIFGNPKVGTPLMQCGQSVAIDLPQKALIWEDANGTVWLSYNDPNYLVKRHKIEGCEEVVKKIGNALDNFAKAATK